MVPRGKPEALPPHLQDYSCLKLLFVSLRNPHRYPPPHYQPQPLSGKGLTFKHIKPAI